MRKTLLAAAVAGVFSLPAAVLAADAAPAAAPASPHTFTGNVGVVNDYVFRGLTQTNGKPAIQGGFDYSHASGFYAGTWLSNISWFTDQNAGVKSAPQALSSPTAAQNTPPFQTSYVTGKSNQASLELDLYGGYKGAFAGDWTYDIGLIRYQYPGTYENLGAYRNPGTTEVYGAIGYKWLTLKYSKAISTYTFGVNEGKGADYIDLSAAVPLDEGLNLQFHVGHQRYPSNSNLGYYTTSGGNNGLFSYTDYKLGLTKDYAGLTFGFALTYANTKDTAPDNDTTVYMNAFGKNIGRSRGILSVTKTF
jgi:uncharacterized protein (TIGR02001 family)